MNLNKSLCATAVALALTSGSAFATNGYFSHGYGTASKGMAGAGVALPRDAMAAATNPAGMVEVGNRLDVGAAIFAPFRSWSMTGMGGDDSSMNYFLIPHFAYNTMLDDSSSVGIAVYGNGGMNTKYGTSPFTFTSVKTGVDLMQLFIAPTYSKKLNDKTSVGISAIIAAQRFAAYGLSPFSGQSSNSAKLTDNGFDFSYGLGARIGILTDLGNGVSLGASYQSRTFMTKFKDYAGLFAEQGDFDIPANATVGVAFKANEKTTVTADVQHIWYSDVAAIANTQTQGGPLGADNGAGFGWDDMTIVKLGMEYAYSDDLTLRAGISHGSQPIPASQSMFNTLAPAVMETHITIGGTKKMGENENLSFAFMYAPENELVGAGGSSANYNLKMDQYELEVSYAKKW